MGFNPLAGIRCFLTIDLQSGQKRVLLAFQSPSGDSLFSDGYRKSEKSGTYRKQFQSPSGDSLFSDTTS